MEIAVTFSEGHPYYWIINLGNEDIYASANPGIVPDGDGVYLISAGCRERISPAFSADTIFIVGKGKVKIRAEEIASCPSFSRTVKGGESGETHSAVSADKYADIVQGEAIIAEMEENQ